MQSFLKEWRQDAMNKHQYESAIFIGDKLLALTNDPNDAFWLAQVHFSTGNYSRALTFLNKHKLIGHSPSCRYLAAHCSIKQSKYEDALSILGDKTPGHLLGNTNKARRRLQHTNGNARSGLHSKKGNAHPERREHSEDSDKEMTSEIKYEAAMCYFRGICFAKQNSYDRAKECYMDAVRIDVQCFEAFDQLMKNCLLPPHEEWAFLESLDFDSIISSSSSTSTDSQGGGGGGGGGEAADFTKMLYTTRLSKYKNPAEFSNAVESLSTHYNLDSNPDLLLSKAELLFTQCRFKQALSITTAVLDADAHNFSFLPLHLACLHELHECNTLFLLAHRLADLHPDEPATWLAVGVYYLSITEIAQARRFFSKASMMNPHFGPAWIGFAHTFALEGEHDQAISAYGTAARLFQGTHLPQLFLGMQHLQLNNLNLAHEHLTTALELCDSDPLLLNELGVVFYHLDYLQEAVGMFHKALAVAAEIDSEPTFWLSTKANLGHAYRRQHQWQLALECFQEVSRGGGGWAGGGAGGGLGGGGGWAGGSGGGGGGVGGRDKDLLSAKGLVFLEMGRCWDAIACFHEALGVQPQDPVATDLLARALEENCNLRGWGVGGRAGGGGGGGGGLGDGMSGGGIGGGLGGGEGGASGMVLGDEGDADEDRTDELLEEAFEAKREEVARRRGKRRERGVGGGARGGVEGSQGNETLRRMSEGGEDSMMIMSDGEE
ncbi:MAG: hypothetical protein Q9220_003872 [cf. Caloplaca sp. 1 TL-2023]